MLDQRFAVPTEQRIRKTKLATSYLQLALCNLKCCINRIFHLKLFSSFTLRMQHEKIPVYEKALVCSSSLKRFIQYYKCVFIECVHSTYIFIIVHQSLAASFQMRCTANIWQNIKTNMKYKKVISDSGILWNKITENDQNLGFSWQSKQFQWNWKFSVCSQINKCRCVCKIDYLHTRNFWNEIENQIKLNPMTNNWRFERFSTRNLTKNAHSFRPELSFWIWVSKASPNRWCSIAVFYDLIIFEALLQ